MLGVGFIVPPKCAVVASSPCTVRRAFRKITPLTFGGASMLVRIEGVYMKTYEFDVLLKDVAEITDEQADAIFAAGCDDGTPTCCNGLAWVHFDRDASSLEDAIRAAIVQ